MGGTNSGVSPGMPRTASCNCACTLAMVMPGGHSLRGLKAMVVSNMLIGAGSVAVCARPALPNTVATSGTVFNRRSVCCSSCAALP